MNTQIYEDATAWLIKHREAELSPLDKQAFDDWLRESPQHVRAYLEMSSVWEGVPELDASWNPAAELLIERARNEGNVYTFQAPGETRPAEAKLAETKDLRNESHETAVPVPTRGNASRPRLAALAATFLIAIGMGAAWYWLNRETYSTVIGEQRAMVLDDGSTIELNARSKVRVRFTAQRRSVELVEGQALFRVAHDTERPFIVHTGTADVRAVGTQFDVYKKRDGTVVTVIEGRVATTSNDGASRDGGSAILISAGEQLVIPATVPLRKDSVPVADNPQRADVEAATAWTRRTLVFDSSPLTEVAEEFNRYNSRQLVITDAALRNLRITGIFSSVDPALLLKFLRAQPELDIEETDREIRVGRR